MIVRAIEDIELLVETSDIECKAAQGKSGKGELPNSIYGNISIPFSDLQTSLG